MSRMPMMPWFPDAHISATRFLSIEARGAYRDLLDYMWIYEGWLPDDDKKIASLLHIPLAQWRRIKTEIGARFTYVDCRFTQKRLSKTYIEAVKKVERNRASGSKGGINNSLKRNNCGVANAKAPQVASVQAIAKPNGMRHISEMLEPILNPSTSRSI